MRICAIIVGGGRGKRLGAARPKALVPLNGVPLFLHGARAFARVREVAQVVVVLPAETIEGVLRRHGRELSRLRVSAVVGGGPTRHASMLQGLRMADRHCGIVMIHDAARPFVTPELIRATARAAERTGAALPAIQPSETVKQVVGRRVRTLDRRTIWLAQTPQAFRSDNLRRALRRRGAAAPTDDVQILERLGRPVAVVPGDPANVKITTAQDLRKVQGNP